MKEIELRFQVPPDQWEAVHRWVNADGETGGAGAHRERLRANYFDTPARDFARAGFALRLRLEGDTWVQTLKGAAPDGMTRLEHNVPVAGDAPVLDLARHADHPAGQGLQRLLERLGSPALQSLFRTDIERLSRAFSTPFGEVELALDRGALLAGGGADAADATDGGGERQAAVSELEIELKQGDPRAVLEVARDWALGRFGLTLELRTKALRGDLLARHEICAPAQSSVAAGWVPGQTQAQALASLLKSVVEPVLGNASQIVTGVHQPEHLHQLRVALRRLRVGVDLLTAGAEPSAPAVQGTAGAVEGSTDSTADALPALLTPADVLALRSLGEGARQLGRGLAPARDADAQAQAPWRQGLERAWRKAILIPRSELGAVAVPPAEGLSAAELLGQTLWQDWKLSIVAWLVRGWPVSAPIEALLPEVDRLGDKALQLARRFDKLDVEGRHHLRRRLRRWKLALEMTSALKPSPRQVAKLMAHVQRVQKPLGELNDLEMGLIYARASLVRSVSTAQADEAARAGFDLAWLTPLRDAALDRMRRRVKRLKR